MKTPKYTPHFLFVVLTLMALGFVGLSQLNPTGLATGTSSWAGEGYDATQVELAGSSLEFFSDLSQSFVKAAYPELQSQSSIEVDDLNDVMHTEPQKSLLGLTGSSRRSPFYYNCPEIPDSGGSTKLSGANYNPLSCFYQMRVFKKKSVAGSAARAAAKGAAYGGPAGAAVGAAVGAATANTCKEYKRPKKRNKQKIYHIRFGWAIEDVQWSIQFDDSNITFENDESAAIAMVPSYDEATHQAFINQGDVLPNLAYNYVVSFSCDENVEDGCPSWLSDLEDNGFRSSYNSTTNRRTYSKDHVATVDKMTLDAWFMAELASSGDFEITDSNINELVISDATNRISNVETTVDRALDLIDSKTKYCGTANGTFSGDIKKKWFDENDIDNELLDPYLNHTKNEFPDFVLNVTQNYLVDKLNEKVVDAVNATTSSPLTGQTANSVDEVADHFVGSSSTLDSSVFPVTTPFIATPASTLCLNGSRVSPDEPADNFDGSSSTHGVIGFSYQAAQASFDTVFEATDWCHTDSVVTSIPAEPRFPSATRGSSLYVETTITGLHYGEFMWEDGIDGLTPTLSAKLDYEYLTSSSPLSVRYTIQTDGGHPLKTVQLNSDITINLEVANTACSADYVLRVSSIDWNEIEMTTLDEDPIFATVAAESAYEVVYADDNFLTTVKQRVQRHIQNNLQINLPLNFPESHFCAVIDQSATSGDFGNFVVDFSTTDCPRVDPEDCNEEETPDTPVEDTPDRPGLTVDTPDFDHTVDMETDIRGRF